MSAEEPQFLEVSGPAGDNPRKIAYLHRPPIKEDGTGLVWLIGLKSDMVSTKAEALRDWASQNGYGLTRFDYSGHGQSGGDFLKATVGDWLEESLAIFENITSGPQIVLGSSTGGHLALLLLRDLIRSAPQQAARIKGLVLIAPAWDLTEELMWNEMSPEIQAELMEKGVTYRPSDYGEPLPITRRFIEEGRNHLFKGEMFDPGRPIVILQGQQDNDVPVEHVRAMKKVIEPKWIDLIEIPDGEHRMSRPQDLELLFAAIKNVG
ncbi:MAG: alpha/beta hydrolase [Alphaproteobacteria bacterium BRH_c36]|nr:MAG: alpha/beta hydrolase [Alphaproteobacteria bacterium BRH_c36]